MHRKSDPKTMWLPWYRIARLDDTISSDYTIEHCFRVYPILTRGGRGGARRILDCNAKGLNIFREFSQLPTPSGVWMRLCKHGKSILLLLQNISQQYTRI